MESIKGLPVADPDASYQDGQVPDFENSRAAAVRAFSQAAALDAARRERGGDSLLGTWATATTDKGAMPIDFGFLSGASVVAAPSWIEVPTDGPPSSDSEEISLRPSKRSTDMAGCYSGAGLPCKFTKPATAPPVPPRPARRPSVLRHGVVEGEQRGPKAMDPPITRTDVFAWMRDDSLEDPEVQALLREENAYASSMQEHLAPLRGTLYEEMLGHMKEADTGLCTLHPGGYGYFHRTFEGKPYAAHYRRRMQETGEWGPEELILDENELLAARPTDTCSSSQKPYLSVSGPHCDDAHSRYVYGVDHVGDDACTLHFVPTPGAAGDVPHLEIQRTDGAAEFSKDGEAFYYVALDAEFRSCCVKRHRLCDAASGDDDAVILLEEDQTFSVYLSRTSCTRFLVLQVASSETQENHLLDLEHPDMGLHVVARRQFGHRHEVDHSGGWLYILTNKDGVKDMKLCRVRVSALPDAALDTWEDVWVPAAGTSLTSLVCFESFAVLEAQRAMEQLIFIQSYGEAGGGSPLLTHSIVFPQIASHTGTLHTPRGSTRACAICSAGLGNNPFFATDLVRYNYSSPTHPGVTYEYNVLTREHRILKEIQVPNYDASLYRAERIVTPRRGVPVSLVYRNDLHPRGLAGGPFPVLLTGYGAYGASQELSFDGNLLSLLDRGLVYALAHVRGGGDLGRDWYEAGRYLQVKNRFNDFVDVAETLVSLHITVAEKLAAWGTSSGGLLVAASMNLRPDLFRAVLLEVPFVDALTTMSDPSIPLTIGEWEEVGNPNEREYFYYMLEYSPYDNIRLDSYPAALLTSSLHDSMVGYWEPLKYASKLRMVKVDSKPVLLKVSFNAGHGGVSDRYQSMQDYAFHWAFLLDQLGLANVNLLATPSLCAAVTVR